MSIAVIIVNYGTVDLTIQAVQSVLTRDHGGATVEIHVLDNASPGNDRDLLAAAAMKPGWRDRVTFWPETENHGFGRGNNVVLSELAARKTPPDKVMLLNPDARLENEAIAILANYLDDHPHIGAVGASITMPGGPPVTAAFRFPGLISELVRTVSFGPLAKYFETHAVPLPPDHPEGKVDWVTGAAVMFRLQALIETGLFDPDFFLYFEETELQYRLAQAGWNTFYVPGAQVVHDAGAATGQFRAKRQKQPAYLSQSRWLYFGKPQGTARALGLALCVLPAAVLNILHHRLRGKPSTLPSHFFRDHWRYGILLLLRRMVSP